MKKARHRKALVKKDSPDFLTLCFRKGESGAFFVYAVEIGGYEVVAPTFEDALRLVPKYLADLAEAGSKEAKAVLEAIEERK